jgi:hypothetical protein
MWGLLLRLDDLYGHAAYVELAQRLRLPLATGVEVL